MRVRWHWKLRRILAALFAAFVCFCPASLAQDGELDPSQPKDITATQSLSASPPKKESGSNCVSSTHSGSGCNSRRWTATRWWGNTARLQVTGTYGANL